MMKKTYAGSGSIHWIVIIGALAAILILAGLAADREGQFFLTGKMGYFFAHSL